MLLKWVNSLISQHIQEYEALINKLSSEQPAEDQEDDFDNEEIDDNEGEDNDDLIEEEEVSRSISVAPISKFLQLLAVKPTDRSISFKRKRRASRIKISSSNVNEGLSKRVKWYSAVSKVLSGKQSPSQTNSNNKLTSTIKPQKQLNLTKIRNEKRMSRINQDFAMINCSLLPRISSFRQNRAFRTKWLGNLLDQRRDPDRPLSNLEDLSKDNYVAVVLILTLLDPELIINREMLNIDLRKLSTNGNQCLVQSSDLTNRF